MKKSITIIIILLAIILITLGLLIVLNSKKEVKKEKIKKVEIDDSYIGKEINPNKTLSTEHCNKDICIRDMTIIKIEDNNIEIIGEIYNKGKPIKNKTITLKYDSISIKYNIKELESKKNDIFKIKESNEDLLKVVDYKIE